jgi:hypothetical protein
LGRAGDSGGDDGTEGSRRSRLETYCRSAASASAYGYDSGACRACVGRRSGDGWRVDAARQERIA